MKSNFFEQTVQRRLKFIFLPALLKPTEYWNYQRIEQIHRKSWGIFIVLDLIIIATMVGIFYWTNDLTIRIFLGVFSLFCLGDIIKLIFSGSQKIWWTFLFCIATIFTLAVMWLAVFVDNYLILIGVIFPINHLIVLWRSKKLI